MVVVTRLNLVLESVCFTNLCNWTEETLIQVVLNRIWTYLKSSLKHLDYILFV